MQCCPMDNFTADKLLAAHDGDVALLYIYLLRTGSGELESAARDLCRTLGEVSAAYEKLQRMGLISDGSAPAEAGREPLPRHPEPAEELP